MKEYTILFELFGVQKKVKVNANNETEAKEKVNCFILNKVDWLKCDSKKKQFSDVKEANDLFDFLNGFKK